MGYAETQSHNAIRMQQYVDVLFAADVAERVVHYKVNDKCDVHEMRDVYRTFTTMAAFLVRTGWSTFTVMALFVLPLSALNTVGLEGRGELNAAVTCARAKLDARQSRLLCSCVGSTDVMQLLSRVLIGYCDDVRIVKLGLLLILRPALRSVQSLTRLVLR